MAKQVVEKSGEAVSQRDSLRQRTYGVVDIGSNTVHLLVARTNGRTVEPILDTSETLGLGADVDADGFISEGKLAELVRTLQTYQKAAAAEGVDRLHLLATHAIRVAGNSGQVGEVVKRDTGLDVEVLAPELEAAIAFMGADADCPSVGPQVMVDIGGGSMQIAVGQYGEVWDSVSLPLGAARVATFFLPTDPPTYLEEAQLVSYLAQVVPPALPLPDTNLTGVVGVGGSLRRIPPLLGKKPREDITREYVEQIIALLRGRSMAEIAESFNLKPDRARLMLPAMLLIREVMRGYGFPPLIMAGYGVREGAILYLARNRDAITM